MDECTYEMQTMSLPGLGGQRVRFCVEENVVISAKETRGKVCRLQANSQ